MRRRRAPSVENPDGAAGRLLTFCPLEWVDDLDAYDDSSEAAEIGAFRKWLDARRDWELAHGQLPEKAAVAGGYWWGSVMTLREWHDRGHRIHVNSVGDGSLIANDEPFPSTQECS